MRDNFISQFNTKDINWFAGDLFSRSRCRISGKLSLSPAAYIYKGKFSLQVMCTSLQMLPLKEPEKYETNKYFILSKFEQLIKAIFILLIYIK